MRSANSPSDSKIRQCEMMGLVGIKKSGSLTSGALDLKDTLLTSILLEGTDKRGRN